MRNENVLDKLKKINRNVVAGRAIDIPERKSEIMKKFDVSS